MEKRVISANELIKSLKIAGLLKDDITEESEEIAAIHTAIESAPTVEDSGINLVRFALTEFLKPLSKTGTEFYEAMRFLENNFNYHKKPRLIVDFSDVEEITILSEDEYKKYKHDIIYIHDWWWLRSCNPTKLYVMITAADGSVFIAIPSDKRGGVRPAIILNISVNVEVGEQIDYDDLSFTILDTNYNGTGKVLALCNIIIKKCRFDEDSVVWENSELKVTIDEMTKKGLYDGI